MTQYSCKRFDVSLHAVAEAPPDAACVGPVAPGRLDELYRALARRLERIVTLQVRVGGERTVIEDACQAAWGQLVRHADRVSLDPEQALAWLITTARREALRLLRERSRDCSLDFDEDACGKPAEAAPGAGGSVAELVEQRERLRVLGALPPRQRRLLLLQAAGYSYEEIAQRTGESRRTVERQLLRARRGARRLAA
jgi:RNA polymerase sigma factor (sigma-70 family)